MGREHYAIVKFNGGEFSPSLFGRVDLEKYQSSTKELTNFFPTKFGGLVKRSGTMFVAAAKNQSYKKLIVSDVPLFYFRLGESSGTSATNVMNGSGTYINTPTLGETGAIDGDSSTAVKFVAASSEHLTIPVIGATGLGVALNSTGVTLECWIKHDTGTPWGTQTGILTFEGTTGIAQPLRLTTGTTISGLKCALTDQSGGTLILETDTGLSITDGSYHHVAITIDAFTNSGQFYLDGVAITTSQSGTGVTDAIAFLDWDEEGAIAAITPAGVGSPTAHIQATIDELAAYTRQLTAAQILAHFNLGNVQTPESGQRLIPFQFNNEQAYLLEIGDEYIRFYRDESTLFTTNVTASITNGDFAVDATGWTLIGTASPAVHDSVFNRLKIPGGNATTDAAATQALAITPAEKFTTHVLAFRVETEDQVGRTLGDQLKLSIGTTSGGEEIFTSHYKAGWHTVEFEPNGETSLFVRFTNEGDRNMYLDDVSILDDQHLEIRTPFLGTELSTSRITQSADIIFTAHPDHQPVELQRRGDLSWSVIFSPYEDGPYLDENTTSTTFKGNTTNPANVVTITASSTLGINGGSGFQASDVGRHLRYVHATGEASVYIITAAPTSLTATVINIEEDAPNTATTLRTTWSLGAWYQADVSLGEVQHWPGAVVLHQARLWWAGSDESQQTLWSSRVNSVRSFKPTELDGTILDDLGVTLTVSEDQVSRVYDMRSVPEGLLVMTSGGEVLCRASQEFSPITPTDFSFRIQSSVGINPFVPAIRSRGGSVIYAQYAGFKIFEAAYRFDINRVVSTDLTRLASHILDGGVTSLTAFNEPVGVICATLKDGTASCLVYEPDDDVAAWFSLKGGGTDTFVENVTSIRETQRDQLWFIISRTINGKTARNVEFLHRLNSPAAANQNAAYHVDGGITDTSGSATITGLSHLEGESVVAFADGNVITGLTVSSGQVVLSKAYTTVHIGLPFTATMESLEIIPAGKGLQKAIFANKGARSIVLRLRAALGGKLIDENLPEGDDQRELKLIFTNLNDKLGNAPIPFSGIHKLSPSCQSSSSQYTIKLIHEEPTPFWLDQIVVGVDVADATPKI